MKLSAREYREQQEHAAAVEASRRAEEQEASANGLVIRGNPSPRSFRVFQAVRDSTKRALNTQERDPQRILQRIANDLQNAHSEPRIQSSTLLAPAPLNTMQMPIFEPRSLESFSTGIQPTTYAMPQGQTTFGIANPTVPGFPSFAGNPPLGSVQQFQGHLMQQQMGGPHPTQPHEGQWQWPWDPSGSPRRVFIPASFEWTDIRERGKDEDIVEGIRDEECRHVCTSGYQDRGFMECIYSCNIGNANGSLNKANHLSSSFARHIFNYRVISLYRVDSPSVTGNTIVIPSFGTCFAMG